MATRVKNPKRRRDRAAVFVVNPGSTSTKLALYRGRRAVCATELKHSRRALRACGSIMAQVDLRYRHTEQFLAHRNIAVSGVDAFVGRGGLLRPLPAGVFAVNARMLADLRACRYGEHASNLGAVIAHRLALEHGKPAYIADPVVVDEMWDVARASGHPNLPRRSKFHALNQRAVAAMVARRLGRRYESCNLVVAHMGGGVSVGAHCKGRTVDVNNALEGDGPFTPQRTGALALLPFYKYVTEHKLSLARIEELVTREGGLVAHFGTDDFALIARKAEAGNRKFSLIYEAFAYQIAKEIGAMAAALSGKVDAIVLTGGLARERGLIRRLRKMTRFIAPVHVVAANHEMGALAAAVLDVLEGRRKARTY